MSHALQLPLLTHIYFMSPMWPTPAHQAENPLDPKCVVPEAHRPQVVRIRLAEAESDEAVRTKRRD